jgi:hypothetical protein
VKQRTLSEASAFVVLVASCAALRIVFRDLPNFAPVAAVALFSGYFFRSARVALCVPLCAMLVSDWVIGGYQWQMMMLVYGMLALPVAARGFLRNRWDMTEKKSSAFAAMAALVGCSLIASVLFFVVTNFGCWLWFNMYEHTVAGLLNCYTQALPFFRYTLAGDLVFACVLFGGYCLSTQLATRRALARA